MVRKYDKPILSVTGLEMIRGDWSPIAKALQKDVLMAILNEEPENRVARIVDSLMVKVLNNELDIDVITITQRIKDTVESYHTPVIDKKTGKQKFKSNGEPYKKAIPQHVKVAQMMKDNGVEIVPGMLIEYVFDEDKGAIPLSMFSGKYDKDVYWNRKIFPPTLRILVSAFGAKDWRTHYTVRKQTEEEKKNSKLSQWF